MTQQEVQRLIDHAGASEVHFAFRSLLPTVEMAHWEKDELIVAACAERLGLPPLVACANSVDNVLNDVIAALKKHFYHVPAGRPVLRQRCNLRGWCILPKALLDLCWGYLDGKSLLFGVELVCTAWSGFASTGLGWKSHSASDILFNRATERLDVTARLAMKQRLQPLSTLHGPLFVPEHGPGPHCSWSNALQLACHLTRLQSLELALVIEPMHHGTDLGLHSLVRLRHLRLQFSFHPAASFAIPNLTSLTSLALEHLPRPELVDCRKCSPTRKQCEQEPEVNVLCSSLRTLSLSSDTNLQVWFAASAVNSLLTSLSITMENVPDGVLEALPEMDHLQSFSWPIPADGWITLQSLPRPEALHFLQLGLDAMSQHAIVHFLPRLSGLSHLSLFPPHNPQARSTLLDAISSHLSSLTRLDIDGVSVPFKK